jgi:DNA-binding NarL/FixJ family response regulator
MSNPINVIAVDDQPIVLQGIRRLIEQDREMQLVGVGSTGDHLFDLMAAHRPDIVLLDVNMPQHENEKKSTFRALPAVARLHHAYPEALIIVLSQHISITLIEGAFEIGVRGYILKDDIKSLDLTEAIRTVRAGRFFLSEAIKEEFILARSGKINDLLTERHREIIRQIASNVNLTYGEHARALGIKEQTLRNHLGNMFRTLEVPNLAACIIRCMQEGIISIDTRYVE